MTNDTRERIDDAALDALIAQTARVEAPAGFAVRVHDALDARDSSDKPARWLRPAMAMAAMLLLAVVWWTFRPVPEKLEVSHQTSASAPSASQRDRPVASASAASALRRDQSVAAAFAPSVPQRDKPLYVRIDHERAVDALDAVAAVHQKAIDPAEIATSAIDVQPADSIAPLNVDTNGPDSSGQGDHR